MDEARLRGLLREHAVRHSVPGAAVGVLRDGRVTAAYHGVADLRTGEPITPVTRFSAGSLTKPMVATAIAKLATSGRLSLDDAVVVHVPELRGSDWARAASVRDLMANTARLPLTARLEFGFERRGDQDAGALSRLVADVAGGGSAGPFWSYSNVGWCVLGRVIETVTGASWSEAMPVLLGVAGMRDTTFAIRAGTGRRARGHDVTAHGPLPVEPLASPAYGPAGTTVVTTAVDLLRFAAWHMHDASLRGLRDVHADVPILGWLHAWCLGWARFDWAGHAVWGWDGLVNGERSVLRLVPDLHGAAVLLANASTGRALYRSLFAELMDEAFGVDVPVLRLDPTPGAAGDLARFAGRYGWPDRRVDVTASPGRLRISEGDRAVEALPLDEQSFVVAPDDPDNPTVTFGAFDTAGRPHLLYVMLWGLPRVDG